MGANNPETIYSACLAQHAQSIAIQVECALRQ